MGPAGQRHGMQKMNLLLRRAVWNDVERLLYWRNDTDTRRASRNQHRIKRIEHYRWLDRTFNDPRRMLYITEMNGMPVGTVRSDFNGFCSELSWTVAPENRGRRVGTEMARLLVQSINGPFRIAVRKYNTASVRIAIGLNMKLVEQDREFLHFVHH
jgi:RimJ/RimL family protein N-acetyltransferase